MMVLFIAPVTPLLQCDPNPIKLTSKTAMIFMRIGMACEPSFGDDGRPLPTRTTLVVASDLEPIVMGELALRFKLKV